MEFWVGEEQIVADEQPSFVKLFPLDGFVPDAEGFPNSEFLERLDFSELTELEIFSEPLVESREMILCWAPKRHTFFTNSEVSVLVDLRVWNLTEIDYGEAFSFGGNENLTSGCMA